MIAAILLLAISYNAILAAINANFTSISFFHVALMEAMVLALGLAYAAKRELITKNKIVFVYFAFILCTGIYASIINSKIFVDSIRNAAIVFIFFNLGRGLDERKLKTIFLLSTILISAGLILEISNLEFFAFLFKPSNYYVNTRGVDEFAIDQIGVFKNALGYEGRFSYGIFNGPRTSSIFLEQVSLANYASVLSIFLLATWSKITKTQKIFFSLFILTVLVTNNTRTTSILILIFAVGYHLFSRLPSYGNIVIAPTLLLMATIINLAYPSEVGDNLLGRLGATGGSILNSSPEDWIGLSIDKLPMLMDSGYAYILYSSTAFGLFAYWAFITFITPQSNRTGRIVAYALSFYIFTNLLIGGTAVFSIKTAAPLWLVIGWISVNINRRQIVHEKI